MSDSLRETQFFQDSRTFQNSGPIQDPPIRVADPKPLSFPARRNIDTGRLSKTILIYILCQDDASETLAKVKFDEFSWSRILRIPKDMQKDGLFENAAQLSLLESLQKQWTSLDQVGLLSQKSHQRIPIQFLNKIFLSEDRLIQEKFLSQDCIFFQGSSGSVHGANRVHPQFSKIWNDILVNHFDIQHESVSLFNQWMCKPSVMIQYISFFKELFPLLVKHPDAFQNAKYEGTLSKEELKRVNDVPWYSHIPFVLERVPRNWVLHKGYSSSVYNYFDIDQIFKQDL